MTVNARAPSLAGAGLRTWVEEIAGILAILAERRGTDFRDYRRETCARGVLWRLEATGSATLAEYRLRLANDAREVDCLLNALVIPCSGFFRDPAVYAALAQVVVPALVEAARDAGVVRAWSAGIASGEEPWSLAMLLSTACHQRGGVVFDLLATDVSQRSIDLARVGEYAATAVADVPDALRARFLLTSGDQVRIADALRAHVRFARHDVMGPTLAPPEAVVASFRLISFRNVLIYFDRRLQQKALERMMSVLEPGGALVLGLVETLPPRLDRMFEPFPGVDPALHIYRRVDR
jgi:chemotaxis methyl-accepting protein methylase